MGGALRRYRLLVGAVAMIFLLAISIFASMTEAGVYPPFVGGVLVGGLAAAGATTILWLLDFVSGNRDRRFGLAGEQASASLFESRHMKSAGWSVVHGVPFQGRGDIDHLAFGPAGVLAVESKWTTGTWAVRNGRLSGPLDDPIAQVRRSADRLERYLRFKGSAVPVTPVLVVWGKGCDVDANGDHVDGVLVLSGPNTKHLTALLDRSIDRRVGRVEIEAAYECVGRYLAENSETKRVARRKFSVAPRAQAS